MRRVSILFCLAAILATAIPAYHAFAFTKGERLNHMLSVCVFKEDAIAILEADAKGGKEAASEVWNAKEACLSVPVQGPQVGKVVFSVKVKRDGKELTAKVVEILVDGKVQAYFLTTQEVSEPAKGVNGQDLILKPERNV